MKQNERRMIDLLRCALTEENPDAPLSDGELKAIYCCSARFDLAHCIAHVLERASLLSSGGAAEAFRNKQTEAVWRTEQQAYECEQIGAILEKAGIDHIFLKGAALRRLYPQPWLRSCADVDILVRKEAHEGALELLCAELGCTVGLRTPHDAKLLFPSGQNVELHILLSGIQSAEEILADVWQMSIPADGRQYERLLSPELFYVYHIAHMAKHFEMGGCGIRPLMDLWIMEKNLPHDQSAADELLSEAGLLVFARTAESLKDCWFSGAQCSPLASRMGEFILSGGVFGTVDQRVASDRAKTGGRMKNLIARAWLPYETMAAVYPSLKGRRWQLPYYELCRWCRLVFRGSAESVWAELRRNQTISKEEIRTAKRLLQDLELL